MAKLPGGALATRPLHFIWIADCSGSMYGDKINQLNYAIRNAIPEMQAVARENPNAEVLVRAVKFNDGVQWQLAQPTPVENFQWQELGADGSTAMGKALQLVATELDTGKLGERALPPVLVLITDGQPTDDFKGGLAALMNQRWGQKAVRIGIAIGGDADLGVLQQFIGNGELKPLQANNAEQLVRYIRWVSTAVLKAASAPPSQAQGAAPAAGNAPDVW